MSKIQKSEFEIIGKLKKIVTNKGKIKYLQLVNSDRDKYWIKVASDLRKNLNGELAKGYTLEISGRKKQNLKTGKIKYKAYELTVIETAEKPHKVKEISLKPVFDTKKKAKVLVCQKSNCWKRGGKDICEKLEASLSDLNLDTEIAIKKTGCLKKCKQAPNIVMLPDKARYSKIKAKQIPSLIEKHLVNG